MRGQVSKLVMALGALIAGAVTSTARGDLGPSNVLVVYDSRVNDSTLVAEHYAGSAVVPGGVGGVAGARPGALAFDLATTTLAVSPSDGTISSIRFREIRNFIRAHLTDNGLRDQVRVLVLTKGVPHRVRDHDSGNGGDNPGNQGQQWNQFDATSVSVDSELVLLWQNVDSGEGGAPGDSKADGVILNPYWQSSDPFPTVTSPDADADKSYGNTPPRRGQIWLPQGEGAELLTPADMVLVSRLDGKTVDDVRGMIDRAQTFVYDLAGSAIILDESDSNGITNEFPTEAELDNQVPQQLWAGDDFEQTRDLIMADGRFTGRLEYNSMDGPTQFVVGPNLDFGGGGIVVDEPVIYLASEGQNHTGGEPSGAGGLGGERYAESMNLAPGAIMNTIESFNGRAFGTLGTLSSQEQLCDFIANGGTFGVGHVWEPFAFTIADNRFIMQNFVLGERTWAEAAWSSIAGLSWQHIVLGDPLATARCSTADLNGDNTLNNTDINLFVALFLAGDQGSDFTNDGILNNADINAFVSAFLAGCG